MQPMLFPILDSKGNPLPETGSADVRFYSGSGTLLAQGYVRVVIGGRGAYIEFAREQMALENLHIPPKQEWRLDSENAYYIERRSNDESSVKVYDQKRTVDYADYKIGMFYIAPAEVVIER